MNQAFFDDPKHAAWPFWVLELGPTATNADIDKAARDIAGRIEFAIPGAECFDTPRGSIARDQYLIRDARAKLQDPAARLLAEFWYVDPATFEGRESNNATSCEAWYDEFGVTLWEG